MRNKILIVANSRKTKGGITSVIKEWEKMPLFKRDLRYYWLETQINAGLIKKLYYLITSYLKALFLIPFFDIVHFHTTPGHSVIVQMPIFIMSLLWHKKIILHLHVGNQLLDYKQDKLFKYVLRKSTKVVVLAEVWKQKMLETFGVNCEVIYNPCEADTKLVPYEKHEPIIFYAAYLTSNKGYDILLKAFKEISDQFPKWRLIMAGAGEISKAQALIHELDLGHKVTLYNWLSKEQMQDMYNKASIFCITSYKEGFPMSALEAWSHGVPLVTTPVGGLVDVLQHKINSLVFDFGNYKQLANCLYELMNDESLRKSISNESIKLAHGKFSMIQIEQSLEALYKSLSK